MTYDPRVLYGVNVRRLEFEARRWALGSEGLSLDYPGALNEPYAPVWRQALRLAIWERRVREGFLAAPSWLRRMWGGDA